MQNVSQKPTSNHENKEMHNKKNKDIIFQQWCNYLSQKERRLVKTCEDVLLENVNYHR